LIRVNDFEFVDTLSQNLSDDPSFRFSEGSSMKIKRTKHNIEFTDIDLKQKAEMQIKGNFTIDDKNLMTGSLKIGLPVVVLSSKKGKILKEVFREDDGEYVWADVLISGEASSPKDNLDEMLKEAAVKLGNQMPLFEQKFEELSN